MNEPVIHGHAVGNARGRGLTDPQPIISPEQAAADRAAFAALAADPAFCQTAWERQRLGMPVVDGVKPRGDTAEKMARAQELRDAGWSDKQIIAEIRAHCHTLRTHLGPNPNTRTRKFPPEIREAKKAQARDLRGRGWSYSKIAREVGVTQQTVSGWFKVMGRAEQ